MKNNNLETTILKTLRAGLDSVDELTQELKNQELQKSKPKHIDLDPSIVEAKNE